MRNEEIVEFTVHEIKTAQTLLATFFFYGVFLIYILMAIELSSNGIVVILCLLSFFIQGLLGGNTNGKLIFCTLCFDHENPCKN